MPPVDKSQISPQYNITLNFENSNDFFASKEDPNGTAVYSYGSIMHSASTSLARILGDTTIAAIDRKPDGSYTVNQTNTDLMGQDLKLDVTDAIEIQIMYFCHIQNLF